MSTRATPVVDDDDIPELVVPDDEEPVEEPAAQEPIAEEEVEATDRRSRRDGKAAKPDLTASEDFRKWQAEADRKFEEERQARLRAEQRAQEIQRLQEQNRVRHLQQQMEDAIDPNERQRYVEEIAAIRGKAYFDQWREWEDYTHKRIAEEGLDPTDARFRREYKSAEEFEADVLRAARDKLKKEAEAAKQAVSPEAIAKLVRAEMAKAAQQSGLNYTDTDTPKTGATGSLAEWQRDTAAVQAGQMSRQAYLKRWEGKDPTRE